MTESGPLDAVAQAVQASPKYALIEPGLVRRLAAQEMAKGRSPKEAVKAVRNKLHQVGGAYNEKPIDYAHWLHRLNSLPHDRNHPLIHDFCRAMMAAHTSTRERLPVVDRIFIESLAGIAPIRSLLDLACGLNPLALPWVELVPQAQVWACDIFSDQVDFLNQFFSHLALSGQARLCDLTAAIPKQKVQLALLLKAIPCLEQLDKNIGRRILTEIQAEHLLISFPAHSLGGRGKGMRQNYQAHFETMVAGLDWSVQRFHFPGELVFRLSRP